MTDLVSSIKQHNDVLFYFGILCFIGTVITGILIKTTASRILGVNAYLKPMKFFLSTAIYVWTLAFYMQYLDDQNAVRLFSWATAIGFAFELWAITFQAARGKTSHFNTSSRFDGMIFTLMGIVITIAMLWALYIGILFFVQNEFRISPVTVWSIRLSIILTVIFAFEGIAMARNLKHTVGANDGTEGIPILNWSKTHGDLRVAHFLGLHALQVVPLLCYFFAKNTTHVFVIAGIYLVFVTATLIRALRGKPVF